MPLLATLAVTAGSIAALLAAGAAFEALAEARQPKQPLPPGRLVAVDGRKLHIRCKGAAAGPTVVIEQGAGAASYYWWSAQDEIAGFARVCTYDRAGYGWSQAAKGRRSIKQRVDELHALLKAAEVPGPYVLVGHSYGGPMISLFARDYPADTAGLVFADTPDMQSILGPGYQQVTRKMHMPMMQVFGVLRRFGLMRLWGSLFPNRTMTGSLAAEPRAAAQGTQRTASIDAGIDDLRSLWSVPEGDRRPLAPGALGAKPVAVISHGVKFPGPFAPLEEDFEPSQQRLLALSSNSLHVVLPHAGHIVQVDAPEAVVEAIRKAYVAARDGTALKPVSAAA